LKRIAKEAESPKEDELTDYSESVQKRNSQAYKKMERS
jgi:hypothetical protein